MFKFTPYADTCAPHLSQSENSFSMLVVWYGYTCGITHLSGLKDTRVHQVILHRSKICVSNRKRVLNLWHMTSVVSCLHTTPPTLILIKCRFTDDKGSTKSPTNLVAVQNFNTSKSIYITLCRFSWWLHCVIYWQQANKINLRM